MAKEVDATYVNILSTIKNAQDNIQQAVDDAESAKSAAEDAGDLLKQLIEFVKVRREYESNGEIMSYIENIGSAVEDIEHNITQIKRGR